MEQLSSVKTKDFLNLQASLSALANTKMPTSKVSYRIGKAVSNSQSLLKDYERKRVDLCKKYGVLSADGSVYDFGDNLVAFNEAFQDLLESEININWHKISLESLSGIPIEPVHLANLDGVLIVEMTEADIH